VRPGITGLWQVSGRNDLTFDEMCRLDGLYVANWSIGLDLRILVRTLRAVVARDGAY
jgi:lipopolysaccharide/colanic/teichoic acid biosynthesis glycosyltransferase